MYDGFTYGFKILFQGERKYRIHENLILVKQNMKTLTVKITKDVLAGRVAGPFQSPPFTNIQISPLGLVPDGERPDGDRVLNKHLHSCSLCVVVNTIDD